MRKKNGAGGINLPDFRLYYKVTVIKTLWYLYKIRNIGQWNKIESPEINPCTYGYLIFTKEARIYNGAKTASSINGADKTEQLHVKHFLTPYTKINSKWIKDLNGRTEAIKFFEENIGRTLDDIKQDPL